MIVECDRCGAKYHYDATRFSGKPSKKLRCSKCQSIFEVFNTRAFEAQPAVRAPVALEETVRRPVDRARAGAAPRSPAPPEREKAKAMELKLPAGLKLSLAVIAGPDAGKIFVIEKPRVVIGREGADFVLDDPEISRQHAALEVAGDEVAVVDLGSTNGTLMGESPIREAPLENQGEFTVGGSTLMLIVTPL